MNVIVLGGSGLIGRAFSQAMAAGGHQVTILSRRPSAVQSPTGVQIQGWDGHSKDGWSDLVEKADAIVNLVGENIGSGWWTKARKQRILDSRLEAGRIVSTAVNGAKKPPAVVMQASAVGYYGTTGGQTLTETSPAGTDFMAQVTVRWEESTAVVETQNIRRIVIRTGLVLDAKEGILPRFLLPVRLFAGGPMGSGRQGISWIHLQDQVRAMQYLLEHSAAQGVYNLTAPGAVSNAEFGRAIARTLHRPFWIPAPAFALRLVLGEMSSLVLDGQYVRAARLEAEGFQFSYPDVDSALKDLLA